jgi:hypothetical protein
LARHDEPSFTPAPMLPEGVGKVNRRRRRGNRPRPLSALGRVDLTGDGQADDRRLVQEAGSDARLVKPVMPNDALSGVTVRTTLRASPAGSFAPHSTRREPPRP